MNHPSAESLFTFLFYFIVSVTAFIYTGGFDINVILQQSGSNVNINIGINISSARWQIHELPVDFSIDPKLRCRPEYVGQYLHRGIDGDYIYNVTATSLVLHSIVLLINEEPVTCGSIIPFATPEHPATLEFKSGVFGKMYIVQWPGEYTTYNCKLSKLIMLLI